MRAEVRGRRYPSFLGSPTAGLPHRTREGWRNPGPEFCLLENRQATVKPAQSLKHPLQTEKSAMPTAGKITASLLRAQCRGVAYVPQKRTPSRTQLDKCVHLTPHPHHSPAGGHSSMLVSMGPAPTPGHRQPLNRFPSPRIAVESFSVNGAIPCVPFPVWPVSLSVHVSGIPPRCCEPLRSHPVSGGVLVDYVALTRYKYPLT